MARPGNQALSRTTGRCRRLAGRFASSFRRLRGGDLPDLVRRRMNERTPGSAGPRSRRWLMLVIILLVSTSSGAADIAAGRKKAGACVACHGEAGIATLPN